MRWRIASLLLLVVVAAPGRAQDDAPGPRGPPAKARAKSDSPAEAAEKVVAALASKDDAALRSISVADEPDPWLVADRLIELGRHDAAEALARAVPRPDVAQLPDYIASRRKTPYDVASTYNNFYEFDTDKSDPAENAGKLKTRPWTVAVEGEIR